MADFSFDKAMGRRIRALQEERFLTQEQLSARLQTRGCDVARSALAKIEAGQRHIYAGEIAALREALGVSYDALFPARADSST